MGNPVGGPGPDILVHGAHCLRQLHSHRIDAIFFRVANVVLGFVLLGFGMYCAVVLFGHLRR